jgi:histidinol-phosphate aminotransferase
VKTRAPGSQREPIRLDLLENPYGPSIAVYEALSDPSSWTGPEQPSPQRLRRELSRLLGVPPDWILPANGIDELLEALFLSRRDEGALVLFPPSNLDDVRRARVHRVPVINLQRTGNFAVDLDLETASDLPPGCWAIVQSPNDPTGTLLEPQEAVRLARACEILVIDERHSAYSGRSLMPIVREFENIVLLQTMETWAGLKSFPLAYAVGPPAALRHLNGFRARDEIAVGSAIAGIATMRDIDSVRQSVHRVRAERSRMFRMIRKLNMASPWPSWANFLPVRVERGETRAVVEGLADRGIFVHQPAQRGLSRMLRISAGTPDQTDALKRALIEVALDL